jgi:hypothetical protein
MLATALELAALGVVVWRCGTAAVGSPGEEARLSGGRTARMLHAVQPADHLAVLSRTWLGNDGAMRCECPRRYGQCELQS